MQTAATTAASGVALAFSGVARFISSNMIRPLQQAFQNLVQWIKGTISRLLSYLNGVMARIRSVMSGGGGGGTTTGGKRVVPRMYARGGHVSGPTLAWVGEGKDPGGEYLIPGSKMYEASMRFLSGARGASVIPGFAKGGYVGARSAVVKTPGFAKGGFATGPGRSGNPMQMLIDRRGREAQLIQINDGPINITTGPVLEFNGQRYVTLEDLQRVARDVKRQTLGEIRTAAGRRATGR
jgi:hypothetical protein